MTWVYANLEIIQTVALGITLLSLMHLCLYTIAAYRKLRQDRDELKEFLKIRTWLNWLLFSGVCIIVFLLIVVPASLFNIEKLDENSFMLYNGFVHLWTWISISPQIQKDGRYLHRSYGEVQIFRRRA
jgi:heme/copper-type cytochrome/quinol oxidase subunit 2